MNKQKAWQQTIVISALILGLSAVACAWILRPARYDYLDGANATSRKFDKYTGNVESPYPPKPRND